LAAGVESFRNADIADGASAIVIDAGVIFIATTLSGSQWISVDRQYFNDLLNRFRKNA